MTPFHIIKESALGRRGRLTTAHGVIETPFFLPVATAGAMKGITFDDLRTLGAQVLLCNTYHLHLQPGEKIVEEAGGLHQFIGWDKPILTDSGGFQVFSLRYISKITDKGVAFRSHINGDPLFIGPEESMRIQHSLGADIIMCFDECPPSTANRAVQMAAVDRTLLWAKQCKNIHERLLEKTKRTRTIQKNSSSESSESFSRPLLFAIVQGGLERDLREKCAEELIAMNFDGYAIGGLAVGENEDEMFSVIDIVCPLLPKDKARYLMGVGDISQQKKSVAKGIDMFDSVLPMREARHGTIMLSDGSNIRILNSRYRTDHSILDPDSPSPLSRTTQKSFLAHLFHAKERLADTIACMQNIGVTLEAMRTLREEI